MFDNLGLFCGQAEMMTGAKHGSPPNTATSRCEFMLKMTDVILNIMDYGLKIMDYVRKIMNLC